MAEKMSRRSMLKGGMTLAAGSLLAGGLSTACASLPSRPVAPTGKSVDDRLAAGARVMWIAAHPDDEALVGAILARSSLAFGNPLYMLVLTAGDGGECCRPQGCEPDLASVRAVEMRKVADLYKAQLQHERYFNASLPVESFPARHEIAKLWMAHKDPARLCAVAIRRFKPDIIFTFDPIHGFTGHPEHQLTSRFAMAGVRMAADNAQALDGLPAHKVGCFYAGLNRYFPLTWLGAADPGPVTETWRADRMCINGWRCRDIMGEVSKAHESQARDMGTVRALVPMMRHVYLRRIDPFTEIYDPFEPV